MYHVTHRPVAVPLISCSLILYFVIMMWGMASWQFDGSNPMLGPSLDVLLQAGAQTTDRIVEAGEWWRLFSSLFVHAGVVHLAFNAMGLWTLPWLNSLVRGSVVWNIGMQLERHFGPVSVSVVYITSGLFSTLCSAVFLPQILSVGASGAIFGVFGAYWSDFVQNRSHEHELTCKERSWLFCILLLNTLFALAFSLLPLVNAFAHIGGFVYGFLAGNVMIVRDRWTPERRHGVLLPISRGKAWSQLTVAAMSGIVCVLLMVWGLTSLYGDTDQYAACGQPCEWLNCFDTPLWSCESIMGGGQQGDGENNGGDEGM